MSEHIFVGVAWPYANGPLHVGHIAGAYLPADIFARYHRLKGNEVLMVSGSDCHGTPITLRADAEGITPESLIRRYHDSFLRTFTTLGIGFDLFTETHSANHFAVVSDFFGRVAEGKYFRSETLRAPYSASAGRFLPDRYVEGRCPACGFDAARGDQCEECGRLLDPEDLAHPRAILDGAPVSFRSTEHLVLELSKLESGIRDWFNHIDLNRWRANTVGLTRDWFARGLEDRAITRDIEWGVPVPIPDSAFAEKRLYVWFEAVIGYLSASIEWARERGEPDAWKNWWLDDRPEGRQVYFIGKDNIPFHTIIWPGLLIAHGHLRLPTDVPANEFLNLEGRKMSTSRGWALTMPAIEDRYAVDQLRYYLTANAPESRDANWSWHDFVRRNNGELVGVWGNLVNRTLGLAFRQWGRVPKPGDLHPRDRGLIEAGRQAFARVGSAIESVKLRAALEETMKLAHSANLYLTAEEPWKLIRHRPERAATIIYVALQTVSDLATLFSPFLPESSARVKTMLGDPVPWVRPAVKPTRDAFGERNILIGTYTHEVSWRPARLQANQALPEPAPLFEKLDTDVADRELETLSRRA